MRVLSLFDGMACGLEALKRAGVPVEAYYASEIDKYAIQIAMKNHPEIIQLGDILNWSEWNWDTMAIDLVLAGSPCQGFSMAGKGLAFEDERSKLYFEFEKILHHCKPSFFLLENVRMKKEWVALISEHLGVEPILINSSLVSAQNRERYYWTNISNVTQPEDRGIKLVDIVLDDVFPVALHNLYGGFKEKSVRVFEGKSPTIRTASGGGHIPSFVKKDALKILPVRVTGRRLNIEGKRDDYNMDIPLIQMVEITEKEKAHSLSTVAKDSMIINLEELSHSDKAIAYMNRQRKDGRTGWDFGHASDIRNEKSACVVANFFKGVPYNVFKDWNVIRKFHPIECERLQTLSDNYTSGVSNNQRYRMIGNGWTVEVIAHILKNLKEI